MTEKKRKSKKFIDEKRAELDGLKTNDKKYNYDGELATNYFIFIASITGSLKNTVSAIMEAKNEKQRAIIKEILEKYKEVGELDEAKLKKLNLKKEEIMSKVESINNNSEVQLGELVKDATSTLEASTKLLVGDVAGLDEIADAHDVKEVAEHSSNIKNRVRANNKRG